MIAILIGGATALASDSGLTDLTRIVHATVPYLVAGFAAQVMLGALSALVPVVLGGGPGPVRVGAAAFDRAGQLRVVVVNTALIVCALPVSSLIRVLASALYLGAMASFLVVMPRAMRAQRRAKHSITDTGVIPRPGPERSFTRRRAGQAVAGLLGVLLVTAIGAAVDPVSLGWSTPPNRSADGPVHTERVEATDMRFTPAEIEVPVGTHLVIELTNTDPVQPHDLVFENGVVGERLAPGESTRIDVGVITADVAGWCSIIGHREMGMALTIVASGSPEHGGSPSTHARGDDGGGSEPIDFSASPGADFAPYDAVLPPLPSRGPTTHRLTLEVEDTRLEVAPGVWQTLWTYNGTAPGPVLHGRVGDTFEVTLVNHGRMGHSIDFHAGALAPDRPMRTIAPGEQLTYTFTAERSGIWLYHCSTMPMSAHIANGMYGAVVIEPNELPSVDRSYVLVQGEYYLGGHDGGEVNIEAVQSERPDLVVFNGHATQYDHTPLEATTGKRVRFWVLDAGPNRASSFHIIGGQFDSVRSEGAFVIDRVPGIGSQALGLQPAHGGFVELVFPEAGHFPFVSHIMVDAERGAHGIVRVRDE
ncbi:multicopper oxidase domain-containing protein [Leucobacter tardus]|uniref:multicopper oxidase domain-containing protein n=1 Tax=Leucobacter tardus TaxID=501483 RepID=UPI0027DE78FE|nr:multicopper oxidase domain-containing protein [Leucobacter tardus]